MRSHYKRIGDYVTLVKLKNSDGAISSLKGININKHFMPSVANVNGTDLSTYRVVKKNQFAFNPMHVGRDEVLPISMLEDDEPIIVSPAYVVFEVKDEEELLPAYLMMWCRRSEFDRNAWFMTDNSVRGGFSWADFCDMELPVPSIEKQREIVREYNVVNDRIALNEQLTQKLEDTAQAIYKQWFVDFEFPISKEYAESIGKPELEGKPYKSSGNELEYCNDAKLSAPLTWGSVPFTKLFKLGNGGTPSTAVPEYWNDEVKFFTGRDIKKSFYTLATEKSISKLGLNRSSSKLYPKNTTFIVARGATTGATALSGDEMAMNQSCYAVVASDTTKFFAHQTTLYLIAKIKDSIFSGAIFNALVTKDFDEQLLSKPPLELQEQFHKLVEPLYTSLTLRAKENQLNVELRKLLLTKMSKA
ncbi:restriction endonuclease subunit S [Vibrio cholerae]